ncbi:MAG: RNA polymerase sigma factor [Pseudomonadota bacterium]
MQNVPSSETLSAMRDLFALLNLPAKRRLDALRPRLHRLAYAWCHDAALADDLVQDCLAKALVRREQLRDEQALEAWLFSILNNLWRDHLRSRRDFVDVADLDEVILSEAPGPEQDYASRQIVRRVRDAIATLPLGQRQVVTLVDLEECAYADVARILAVPVGTVMSRLHRARQALREHFQALQAAEGAARSANSKIRRIK